MVDEVVSWDDSDGSAIGAINIILEKLKFNEILIFANGGDRNKNNIPEINYFKNNHKVKFKFGIGGNYKVNSSSMILNNFKKNYKNLL